MDVKTIQVESLFNNDEVCLEYLCNLRWHKKPECPYCRSKNTSKKRERSRRPRLQCHSCHKSFSPTVNTIMHGTRIPLPKWFLAVSLIAESKKGISSRCLARRLDLPVKTAYSLSQRIRKGMLGTKSPVLEGIIEIDKVYLGGRDCCLPEENIGEQIREANEQLLVDIEKYRGVDVRSGVCTNELKRSAKEYVRRRIHATNGEGFWSIVRQAWNGTHHHYSMKYMPYYIAEALFKYENEDEEMFNNVLAAVARE